MERKSQSSRWIPSKPSPDKAKRRPDGFFDRFHGPSLKAFLRSLFSCSGSGVQYDDDSSHDNVNNKKPVISPTQVDGKKRKRAKHTTSTSPQSQIEIAIAPTTGLKKSPDTITNSVTLEIEKQVIVLPSISDKSNVLSENLRSSLYKHLPTLVRGREWVLLYSTWKHGISLRTLYRRSAHLSAPFLLAVEDSKGAVFGGLLTGPLNPTTKSKFQGANGTFVFTNTTTEFGLFHPTGVNRYYFLCTNEMLAFGGGGAFALQLDEGLMHGSSGLSETFGNCCLACTEEFTIKHVELWGFAHTSKYVPEKALYRAPEASPGVSRL